MLTSLATMTAVGFISSKRWSRRLQTAELRIVRICSSEVRLIRAFAIFGTKLGDGWIYPFLVALVVSLDVPLRWTVILVSALSAASLHCIYPFIKPWAARRRPFEADPSLLSLLPPLDIYSFPSGHMMTLTAVSVPIVLVSPECIFPLSGFWLLISWSRIACAHHYPSDILAGSALGILAAGPLAVLCGI